jgi:thiol:disulfide interchange protein
MHHWILTLLFFLLFVPQARAQFAFPGGSHASKAEMVSEVKAIAPGSTFTVALKLEHPGAWHSYYQNSGGIEQSPAIQWTLPAGFSAGLIQWPVPQVKDGFFGKSFVYSGAPVFLVDLKAPADLEIGKTVTLSANASWQICEESCLNEEKKLTLNLSSGPVTEKDPAVAALFEKARASLPEMAAGWKFSAMSDGGDITLRVTPVGMSDTVPTDFIPNQQFVLPASAGGSITKDRADWRITLKRATKSALETDIPQGKSFSGILIGPRAIVVPDTAISTAGAVSTSAKPAAAGSQRTQISFAEFLPILGGMFLGGLVLNLMPCVFPVIGLKIMGFVQQAGHNRRKIVLHGLVFTLGVLISFWILSLVLFLGGITNWGNQLQDPRIILGAIVLMLLLGMNMFGVFEIGTSVTGVGGSLIGKQGIAGTFFSGVLATLIATPCTGPFLGIAIGVAVKLPAIPFFIAFTVMALGLALPYLVLSMFPALVEKLPRPGPWMESFKQGMSFLLFSTAGIFLWVYSDQVFDQNSGQKGLWVMVGLSAVAVAAWIYGRWNQPVRKSSVRWIAKGLAAAVCTGGILMAWPWPEKTPVADDSGHAMTWGVWSQEEQDRLLAEGHPVYVDFTAKWCLTCQLNKSRAYPAPVVDLIKAKGIVALKADKTSPNPSIEAGLNKLGRTAIPVNVLWIPGKAPVITPALLSADYLLELFSKVVTDPAARR